MSEADNLRKWPADRRGVYEVWYTTWNHPATGQGFWLRYITEAPVAGHPVPPLGDAPRGELWFARFDPRDPARTFGVHRRFAARDVTSSDAPFRLAIAGSELANDRAIGQLAGDGHDIRWDLRWEPSPATLRFYPDALYARGGLAQTMALSPNPRVPLSGTLVIDGEELAFDRALAGQSHVWGKKHALSWTWAHCNDFVDAPGTVLELIGARLERRGVTLPPVTAVAFVLDGERIVLNQLRHIAVNRSTWRAGHVTFRARSLRYAVAGTFSCRPEHMVNAPYVDPDGQDLWCANTEIADAQVTVHRRDGLRWVEHRRLEAHGRAHFEVGSRHRDPAVTTPHVLAT